MRRRFWIVALAVALVAIVGTVVIVAGSADSDSADSEARSVSAAGITAKVPSGWHLRLPGDPIQLGLFTKSWFIGENCDGQYDYTTAMVGVTRDPGFGPAPIPRPKHFKSSQGTGIQTGEVYGDIACGSTSQAVVFTDKGQNWKATVTLGRDTPKNQRAEAYRILDSLRLPKSN